MVINHRGLCACSVHYHHHHHDHRIATRSGLGSGLSRDNVAYIEKLNIYIYIYSNIFCYSHAHACSGIRMRILSDLTHSVVSLSTVYSTGYRLLIPLRSCWHVIHVMGWTLNVWSGLSSMYVNHVI